MTTLCTEYLAMAQQSNRNSNNVFFQTAENIVQGKKRKEQF